MKPILLSIALVAACSSSSPSVDAPGGGGFTLTIDNDSNWCNVTVNGTTSTATSPPAKSYPSGTVVNLMAVPTSATFVFGYWVGTAGDTTAAHDTNATTTVTMTAAKSIQACCPFANMPSTPCPTP